MTLDAIRLNGINKDRKVQLGRQLQLMRRFDASVDRVISESQINDVLASMAKHDVQRVVAAWAQSMHRANAKSADIADAFSEILQSDIDVCITERSFSLFKNVRFWVKRATLAVETQEAVRRFEASELNSFRLADSAGVGADVVHHGYKYGKDFNLSPARIGLFEQFVLALVDEAYERGTESDWRVRVQTGILRCKQSAWVVMPLDRGIEYRRYTQMCINALEKNSNFIDALIDAAERDVIHGVSNGMIGV